MTPEEVMQKINKHPARIGGTTAAPALSLVDMALGTPVATAQAPLPIAAPIPPTPAPAPVAVAATKPTPVATPATPVTQPEPKPVRSTETNAVIETLLLGPGLIEAAQEDFDCADRHYKQRLSTISIKALSALIFPGKKAEDAPHAASNDTERDLAIQDTATHDPEYLTFSANREAALRNLQRARNQFEAAKLLAALLTSENRQ